jgi:antitoxin (DNA-binding transcriptional repressor) of toxin-antitoxin stability system
MTQVSLEEAQHRLRELVNAAMRGEEVVIAQADQPLVRLAPVVGPKPRPRFGSAKGLIVLGPDFDAPLDDFREYME